MKLYTIGFTQKSAERFFGLLRDNGIPQSLDRASFEASANCLLCSEPTPEQCHRRLVEEWMAREWTELEIIHLV